LVNTKYILTIAGILSFGVAVFQAVISFVPEWSSAFDAGDALVSNPLLLLAAGLLMALVFVLFGLYALSGAGMIRRLPLLNLGLFGIGAVYTVRGIAFIPQLLVLLGILPSVRVIPLAHVLSSLVSLILGILYLTGLVKIRSVDPIFQTHT
jgi:putative oxidoreductase